MKNVGGRLLLKLLSNCDETRLLAGDETEFMLCLYFLKII